MSETSPPTAAVAGNRWPDLPVPPLGGWTPTLTVSVVVAGRRGDDLRPLLATLQRQTYPADLLDVVVVAAGAALPDGRGDPQQVVDADPAQLPEAAGARAARGDVLCFLDPAAPAIDTTVEAHARWHHASGDAVTLGWLDAADWLRAYRTATADLADPGPEHFRAVDLRGLGVCRRMLESVGGVRHLGGRRTASAELGWRLSTAGALFVPEPLGEPDPGQDGGRRPRCPRLVPPDRRPGAPLPTGAVPAVVARVPAAGAPADAVAATVAALLAADVAGLEVRVEDAADAPPGLDDPRVSVGPATGWWTPSPLQVWVPPAVVCSTSSLRLLGDSLAGNDLGALRVTVPGLRPVDASVTAVSTRALSRARRVTGAVDGSDPSEGPVADTIAALFGRRWVGGERLGFAAWRPDRPVILGEPAAVQQVDADVARMLVKRLDAVGDDLEAARARIRKLDADRDSLRERLTSARGQVKARDRRLARTRSDLDAMRVRASTAEQRRAVAERRVAALERRRSLRLVNALGRLARARRPRQVLAALRAVAGALRR